MDVEERHGEMPEEKDNELSKSYQLARDEVSKTIDVGSFIISDDAVEELKKLVKSLYRARREDTFFEYLEVQIIALKDCIEKIKVIAKTDLKVI